MNEKRFRVMITGDLACFVNPTLKSEPVSYDVPTPSALEGLLKAIYWKPAMRYVIDKIIVFNPIKFLNVRTNEVKDKPKLSSVMAQMRDQSKDICIYTSENRTQRSAMLLKNVCYGVEFHIERTGIRNEREKNRVRKHEQIFQDRMDDGEHFYNPYLGRSDFPVRSIRLVEDFDMSKIHPDIASKDDVDFGYMVYEMYYKDGGKPIRGEWEDGFFSDKAIPLFYRPHMKNGVIDVDVYKEGCTW